MHSFDPEIAKRVGVNAAVIYQNIIWWTQKNAANERHYHDGKYWTYNSIKAFEELFPYLTGKQIRLSLDKLETEGLIESGTFNKAGYDRTKWYCPKGQMDLPKKANGDALEGKAIPDSKPVHKPLIEDIGIFEIFNEIAESVGWPKVQAKTPKRERLAASRIKDCGGFDNWKSAMERAAASDFLSGKATGSTPASFDWLNNASNFAKLMEGNYDNRTDSKRNSASDTEARILAFAGRTRAPSEPDWF